ncbi:hypothetical protein EZS27_020359 [termite gut metagenome]|uniref:Uncharacterized protein n=1 Tax=termite gut metagenome TaxID=433724 RepID=A0A5J4RBI9_9ZZZZ
MIRKNYIFVLFFYIIIKEITENAYGIILNTAL